MWRELLPDLSERVSKMLLEYTIASFIFRLIAGCGFAAGIGAGICACLAGTYPPMKKACDTHLRDAVSGIPHRTHI